MRKVFLGLSFVLSSVAQAEPTSVICYPTGLLREQEKMLSFSYDHNKKQKKVCSIGRDDKNGGKSWVEWSCKFNENESEMTFDLKKGKNKVKVSIFTETSNGEFLEGYMHGDYIVEQELSCEVQD